MNKPFTRPPLHWAFCILACALAIILEWQRPELITRWDEGLRDTFIRLIADDTPENRLTIIDIDEASLLKIGPWPWTRDQIATLVEILLTTYRARAVGLDIVFQDSADSDGDARLAALATHAPVTLAQIFDYAPRYPALALGVPIGGMMGPESTSAITAYGHLANHAGLAQAKHVGNIGYIPDNDGVLRRLPTLTYYQGHYYPSFASMLFASVPSNMHAEASPIGDKQGFWRIPFHRGIDTYTVISAADILAEQAPVALLEGRYILVGASALGLGDRVSLPLVPLATGVMAHAASLSALLDIQENVISMPWSGYTLLLSWLLSSIGLVWLCLPRLSAWGNLALLLALSAGWLTIALWGAKSQAEWSVTAPIVAYIFLLLTAIPHEWWRMQRKARRLVDTFSHYVAGPVLDEILRRDLQHSLDPALCEVTVLVADMENYTRTTSSLPLEDAAALTKAFLGCLTRPVLATGGTLDRYTGDGLVAFWGAPLPCQDQADQAVSAAISICNEVDELNKRLNASIPLRVRVGIESGRALVGDLGTSFRSTYTAVGDCINYASRLEAAAREQYANLIIGETAQRKLLRHRTRSLGEITLRGTQSTIEIFTVLADSPVSTSFTTDQVV